MIDVYSLIEINISLNQSSIHEYLDYFNYLITKPVSEIENNIKTEQY